MLLDCYNVQLTGPCYPIFDTPYNCDNAEPTHKAMSFRLDFVADTSEQAFAEGES